MAKHSTTWISTLIEENFPAPLLSQKFDKMFSTQRSSMWQPKRHLMGHIRLMERKRYIDIQITDRQYFKDVQTFIWSLESHGWSTDALNSKSRYTSQTFPFQWVEKFWFFHDYFLGKLFFLYLFRLETWVSFTCKNPNIYNRLRVGGNFHFEGWMRPKNRVCFLSGLKDESIQNRKKRIEDWMTSG